MREILFRGKTKIGGFWFEGAYAPENKIIIGYFEVGGHDPNEDLTDCKSVIRKVLPETVGQYTGLIDKNGKKVFEGDIVSCSCGCPHEVIYVKEYAGTYGGGMPAFYLSDMNDGYAWIGSEEVIGNVYDNPELLEGGEGK